MAIRDSMVLVMLVQLREVLYGLNTGGGSGLVSRENEALTATKVTFRINIFLNTWLIASLVICLFHSGQI
jgi:hypothetical protein